MKKITEDTVDDIVSMINVDSSVVFARLHTGNNMYILKVFGETGKTTYRFLNLSNVRTKLTNGADHIAGAISEAIQKGCEVFLLDNAWQLSVLINKYTQDQDGLTDEAGKADPAEEEVA